MNANSPRARALLLGLSAVFLIAASTPAPPRCGDHLLEAGETCTSCAADCRAVTCTPGETRRIAVDLTVPSGLSASAVTVRLAYRTDRLAVPGEGREAAVAKALRPATTVQAASAHDLGYALRLVLVRGEGFANGPLAEVTMQRCTGQPEPSAADLSCAVEGCAGGAGPIDGCTCSARLR
jgi:hypothetical protein